MDNYSNVLYPALECNKCGALIFNSNTSREIHNVLHQKIDDHDLLINALSAKSIVKENK